MDLKGAQEGRPGGWRRWARVPFLVLMAGMLFLLTAEGALRLGFGLRNWLSPPARAFFHDIGWRTTPHVHRTREVRGYGPVEYSTQQEGFRVFGDPQSKNTKLLVLGDSYTQGQTVSDGKAYYGYLQDHVPGLEVFAYGCGGYGSLQEYMILDRYIDLIRPDVVLWQFCSNDIINNSFAMEADSTINNNHMTRPYLEGGHIRLRYPARLAGLRGKALEHSYLLRALKVAPGAVITPDPAKEPSRGHPAYPAALEITAEIMQMVQRRAAPARVVAFAVSAGPQEADFRAICSRLGIGYVAGVAEAVAAAKEEGVVVDGLPYDHHWNAEGHAIAGRAILDYLLAGGYVPAPGP